MLAVGAATLAIAVAALPIFLLGALAVFIRKDLDFTESALGIAASAYYATSALASIPGGRLTERLGGRRATSIAASVSVISMLGIALFADNWGVLLGLMAFAGTANGIALPATNLVIARSVPTKHQGIAFGLKQSSGPIATIVSGIAVPVIGLTIGWRWAFVLVAVAASPLLFLGKSAPHPAPSKAATAGSVARGPLVLLAFGAAAAVIGGSSLGAFYVESAVAHGVTPAVAGTLLAAGSVSGIAARIGWGHVAGRSQRIHIPLLSGLLASGALGYLLFGAVNGAIPIAAATILTFATGWGWPAVFNYAIVVRSQAAPALATGIAATGLYGGGIVGPAVFGILVERSGYQQAWSFVAIAAVTASILFFIGGRYLDASVRP